jgi:hypothetical protein
VFSHSTYSPSGDFDTHDSVVPAIPGNSVGNRYLKTPSVLLSYFTECLHMVQNEVITRRVSETEKYRIARLANQIKCSSLLFGQRPFTETSVCEEAIHLFGRRFGLFVEYVVNVPRLNR